MKPTDRQGAQVGDRRAGRGPVERAAARCVGESGPHGTGTPIGSGAGLGRDRVVVAQRGTEQAAAAATPFASVPVTTQVGRAVPGRRAATSPPPLPMLPAGWPCWFSSSSSGFLVPTKRAKTPLRSGPSASSRGRPSRPHRCPGPDEDRDRLRGTACPGRRRTPAAAQRRSDAIAGLGRPRRRRSVRRPALALEPVHERLGPGADHRGDAHRRGPVAVVPPDPVAAARGRTGRSRSATRSR